MKMRTVFLIVLLALLSTFACFAQATDINVDAGDVEIDLTDPAAPSYAAGEEPWNLPQFIPDPEAEKPDDWDDDADGEWAAPLLNNPQWAPEPEPVEGPEPKEVAQLIVIKKVINSDPTKYDYYQKNEPFVVEFTLHNVGKASARKVHINDMWPKEYEFPAGESIEATIDEILPGASATHSYKAMGNFEGEFRGSRAKIDYLAWDGDLTPISAFSSFSGKQIVVSEEYMKNIKANNSNGWTIFGVLLAGFVVVPLALYLNIHFTYEHGVKKSKSS